MRKVYYVVDFGIAREPFVLPYGFRNIRSTESFENKQEALVRAKEIFKEYKDSSEKFYVSVSSFDEKTEQIITEDILLLNNLKEKKNETIKKTNQVI